MWREIERKTNYEKPYSDRVLRKLKAGDIVKRGDRTSGVTVTVIDDDHAEVFALQMHLMIHAGEEVERSTGNPKDPIMPF